MNKKIAILFSGSGTNLKAICEYANKIKTFDVICAITNNPSAGGIAKANEFGVQTIVIEHKNFANREEFDKALVDSLSNFEPDLVVLAGFMRILTPIFTKNVKAINIHPSLLPSFKGANAIKQAFESGAKVGGVTIHWVSEGVDEGEIIAQSEVAINDDDTIESFTKRVQETEWALYPKTIEKILQGE